MSRRRSVARRPGAPHLVCDDLAAWCATQPDADRQVLEPASTVRRPLPTTIDPEVDPSFAPLCEHPVPERALVRIPGARLLGDAGPRAGRLGLVVLPDDRFAGELVALTPEGRRSMLGAVPAFNAPLPSRPQVRDGAHYAFLGFGMHHYYHWSHDLVMGARGLADHLPPDARIVVPAEMRPFQEETLALLGLEQHERVAFPPGGWWELEELYVITPKLKTQIDTPEPFAWFRDAAFARSGIAPGRPRRRLYLSRRDDGHWRTTNEAEVEGLLAGFGFETVAPGRMTFREQIETFAAAEVIVGTGAGLFNMAFAPPEARVLQLQEPRHIVHALWTQAAAQGLEYHYLLCDSVPNPDPTVADADLHVPPERLRAALQSMGV